MTPIDAKRILEEVDLVLFDVLNIYASEFADENSLARSRSRIQNRGGVMAYIADMRLQIKMALNPEMEVKESEVAEAKDPEVLAI